MAEIKVGVDGNAAFDGQLPVEAALVSGWGVLVDAAVFDGEDVFPAQNVGVNPGIKLGRAVMQQIDVRILGNQTKLKKKTGLLESAISRL